MPPPPVLSAAVLNPETEFRAMLHDASSIVGVERILHRVARLFNCHALLVESSCDPALCDGPLQRLGADIDAVCTGRTDAVSAVVDGRFVGLLPVGEQAPRPALVVLGNHTGQRISSAQRSLLAEITTPLGLAWMARSIRRQESRLRQAEARNREAVLYLLLSGSLAGARRVAGTLGPPLPEMLRVHLVECAGRRLDDVFRWCTEAAAGDAWIVQCPVYRRHLVVLARSDADRLVHALRQLAARDAAFQVGSGQEVPLAEFGVGYQGAFHALAVARHRPDRYAEFQARGDLSDVLSGVGGGWARQTLVPLLDYTPERPQDPDAQELLFTLTSWLTFRGNAVRHLKVHRNTLTARLHHLETLLGVDLTEVANQAQLNLALRLLGAPSAPEVTLAQLLARPEVRFWATQLLGPVRGSDPRMLDTLRSWLDNQAQIGATAEALGVSASGVRKRLMRVEDLIQRSLLTSPSARYELSLALVVLAGEMAADPHRRCA